MNSILSRRNNCSQSLGVRKANGSHCINNSKTLRGNSTRLNLISKKHQNNTLTSKDDLFIVFCQTFEGKMNINPIIGDLVSLDQDERGGTDLNGQLMKWTYVKHTRDDPPKPTR